MLLFSPSVLQAKSDIPRSQTEGEQNIYYLPLMLDLTAGFNAHPFAQKIKLDHPETTGQNARLSSEARGSPVRRRRRDEEGKLLSSTESSPW